MYIQNASSPENLRRPIDAGHTKHVESRKPEETIDVHKKRVESRKTEETIDVHTKRVESRKTEETISATEFTAKCPSLLPNVTSYFGGFMKEIKLKI